MNKLAYLGLSILKLSKTVTDIAEDVETRFDT